MHLDSTEQAKQHRKHRDRDSTQTREPAVDLVDRYIALQRKNAAATRPKDRSERIPSPTMNRPSERSLSTIPSTSSTRIPPTSPRRQTSHQHTQATLPRPEADPDDFSRRLKISTSTSPRTSPKHVPKLFNPDTDSVSIRHTHKPEIISEAPGTYNHRGTSSPTRDVPTRQLFDHRKDDPVRFAAVLPRPNARPAQTQPSLADYLSASSTSSYANSASSSITLSSNTDDSSASSAVFDHQRKPAAESGTNAFAVQLKRLYRTISTLEDKVKQHDADDFIEESRIMLKGKEVENEDIEKEKWKKQIENHKKLAEAIHNLLEISLAPTVPESLRNIPTKYNIIIRLWTFAFHKLLESLRRASFNSPVALEHLQGFIYYAYTFYTGLLVQETFKDFKSGWLEALGDLARYMMAVATMITGNTSTGVALTATVVNEVAAASGTSVDVNASRSGSGSDSGRPIAQVNGSRSPSVGVAAARLIDIEPEKERWRRIAREWYGLGLTEMPATGKLHHHLGLLSREVEGEELRGIYHFIKSMTTRHPFSTSRESVLPLWSAAAQTRRTLPDARARELFVLLHGMLFTNIQLDDFQSTLARLIERLQIEDVEERDWIMMAVINVSSVLEYGKPTGVLRNCGAVGGREPGSAFSGLRVVAKRRAVDEEKMDVDDQRGEHDPKLMSKLESDIPLVKTSPPFTAAEPVADAPAAFHLALQLTFTMLAHVLQHPTRRTSPFAESLNPYVTVLLTFITTIVRNSAALDMLERDIPWEDLARFLDCVPSHVAQDQLRQDPTQSQDPGERWSMLTSGCLPPLPEDWCLRGMDWVGRRVFERGFWKGADDRRAELEVLDKMEVADATDGVIEEDCDDNRSATSENSRRWIRIFRSAIGIAGVVKGFTFLEDTRKWSVEGMLLEKVERWKEEEVMKREAEAQKHMGRRFSGDLMEVDEEDTLEDVTDSEDDENDAEEVKALKARRQYLRSLLQSASREVVPASQGPRRSHPRKSWKSVASTTLPIVPGYTALVVDTNILLSSLSMFASVVESLRWTVIVPLPVIMELDGLASNVSPLGDAAQAALAYITSRLRSHAASLKVQTSKGNYLATLSVRTEQIDFNDNVAHERNMDDLILKAAIWQEDHWVDRSSLLKDVEGPHDKSLAVKVVLLSLDRNLRLKARARQLSAADIGENVTTAIPCSATAVEPLKGIALL